MMSTISFFVESAGIKLPDGTVFGGGIDLKYLITDGAKGSGTAYPFVIYHVIGKDTIRIGDPKNYREMREWVHEQVAHYESCGMKLWVADHSDWGKAKYKKIVTMDW